MMFILIILIMLAISIALIFSSNKENNQRDLDRHRLSFTIGNLSDKSKRNIKDQGGDFLMVKFPQTISVTLPQLKRTYKGSNKVASRSQAGLKHEVNLENLSCSCPWWQERCAHLPIRDIRRVDRHVARLLIRSKAIEEFDEIIQVTLGYEKSARWASGDFEGFGADYLYRTTLRSGMEIAISFRTNSPWVNVITRRRKKGDARDCYTGPYSKYGFNLIEERWSYGGSPLAQNSFVM